MQWLSRLSSKIQPATFTREGLELGKAWTLPNADLGNSRAYVQYATSFSLTDKAELKLKILRNLYNLVLANQASYGMMSLLQM